MIRVKPFKSVALFEFDENHRKIVDVDCGQDFFESPALHFSLDGIRKGLAITLPAKTAIDDGLNSLCQKTRFGYISRAANAFTQGRIMGPKIDGTRADNLLGRYF